MAGHAPAGASDRQRPLRRARAGELRATAIASHGPTADAARAEFSALRNARGHAVENARLAVARLERAFEEGALQRTEAVDEALADLSIALEQSEGQKLGAKSAEAARLVGRRLERLLADA